MVSRAAPTSVRAAEAAAESPDAVALSSVDAVQLVPSVTADPHEHVVG